MKNGPLIARALTAQDATRRAWDQQTPEGLRAQSWGHPVMYESDWTDAQQGRWMRAMIDCMRWSAVAPLYTFNTDLTDMLEVATLDVPDYELHPLDARTPTGFVVFARPIFLGLDEHNTGPIYAEGLAWIGTDEALQHIGTASDTDLGIMFSYLKRDTLGAMWPSTANAFAPWLFGHTCRSQYARHDKDLPEMSRLWALIGALFRLLNERVVVERRLDELPRSDRRAVQRTHPDFGTVTIWTLREGTCRQANEESESWRRLQYRHPVRQHWRNQWYPSQGRHAPKLIDRYIKGPPGAPLRINRRVAAVVR